MGGGPDETPPPINMPLDLVEIDQLVGTTIFSRRMVLSEIKIIIFAFLQEKQTRPEINANRNPYE